MSKKNIKIRARLKNGVTNVKTLISHPMETGLRKDKKSGRTIPAHFIQEVNCLHNGELKLSTELGISVSRNPYLQFELEGGAKGDTLELTWRDNWGKTDTATAQIK
ncbi:MAG: thiosulfate oxidation carrier complex protein SoxZ [gamma proteobacterium symbiont of Ctena orbiculata]|nr:MAG: thiosulfate oxidation carrier complex protein SoxZ [gamma proteobacterium symbiont of Ctena orbiculata]PVV15658.1 MAG: thiosulfate oxidation carrier complex protein SoxZ [gamma proteobacterium symbiont of Ctena orbiculata]